MERKVPETQNGSTGSRDVLTEIPRQGARDMPAKAIENEVAEYIARHTACLTMVFKLARRAERHWRRLNGHQRLADVIEGIRFVDGVRQVAA